MVAIKNFFLNNYSWIFSGIGVAILISFIGFFINKFRNKNSQYQNIRNNSKGIQVGRDLNINTDNKHK